MNTYNIFLHQLGNSKKYENYQVNVIYITIYLFIFIFYFYFLERKVLYWNTQIIYNIN